MAIALLATLVAGPGLAQTYSASGTHQCQSPGGGSHQCVVTGLAYGNCVEAASSLRAQDCCASGQACPRDNRDDARCRGGGTSTGFTLNYCIPGRRF